MNNETTRTTDVVFQWQWRKNGDGSYSVTNEGRSGLSVSGYFVCTDEESAKTACEHLNSTTAATSRLAELQEELDAAQAERDDVRIELALKLCEGIATEPGATHLQGWGDLQPSLRELAEYRPIRAGVVFRMSTLLLAAAKAAKDPVWLEALDIALSRVADLQAENTTLTERIKELEKKND